MYRFLIVDDQEDTLKQLALLLGEEFEGAVVDTAGTVAEGQRLLAVSVESRTPYHAVLLDFMLPQDKGLHPEMDQSLCEAFRRQSPRTLIIHITAHGEDTAVLAHLAASHSEPAGPWPLWVSTSDETYNYAEELLRKLKASLFSMEIASQLDELFNYPPQFEEAGRAVGLRRPVAREGGVTHRLAVLMQKIEQYWPDLSESLRARIRTIFVVEATGDEVRVGLL